MIIEDFNKENHLGWIVVNDGVMGGLSRSRIEIPGDGTARFSGKVSLENNGGFASTRAEVREPIPPGIWKVAVRVQGDGKRYSFRIRTSGPYSRVSYKTEFDTRKGEWETHEFPLSDFIPTFRGRTLEGIPPIEGARIQEVGFLIADKQEGAFVLLIDWIRGLP
ncbi:MAG: CIA30 family protein [Phaeodactylibacter sp.]|nr:CIA30 family protein [Phaeodactylibacter sp.]